MGPDTINAETTHVQSECANIHKLNTNKIFLRNTCWFRPPGRAFSSSARYMCRPSRRAAAVAAAQKPSFRSELREAEPAAAGAAAVDQPPIAQVAGEGTSAVVVEAFVSAPPPDAPAVEATVSAASRPADGGEPSSAPVTAAADAADAATAAPAATARGAKRGRPAAAAVTATATSRRFQRELQSMMYGFGDAAAPLPQSVSLMEDLVVDYLQRVLHRASRA